MSFLVRYGDHALALRAVCTERQFYSTHHKEAATTPPLLALLEHHADTLRGRGQEGAPLPAAGGTPAAAAWEAALAFAARCTYARAVL